MTKELRHADIVGAIRLALLSGDTDATRVKVIAALCGMAPATPGDATAPTQLLLDAIREVKGRLTT